MIVNVLLSMHEGVRKVWCEIDKELRECENMLAETVDNIYVTIYNPLI